MPLLIGWAPTPPAAQPRPFSAGAPPAPKPGLGFLPGGRASQGALGTLHWVQGPRYRSGN